MGARLSGLASRRRARRVVRLARRVSRPRAARLVVLVWAFAARSEPVERRRSPWPSATWLAGRCCGRAPCPLSHEGRSSRSGSWCRSISSRRAGSARSSRLLFMLTPLGTTVAAPLAGRLADRIGLRRPRSSARPGGRGPRVLGFVDGATPLALVALALFVAGSDSASSRCRTWRLSWRRFGGAAGRRRRTLVPRAHPGRRRGRRADGPDRRHPQRGGRILGAFAESLRVAALSGGRRLHLRADRSARSALRPARRYTARAMKCRGRIAVPPAERSSRGSGERA